MSQALYRKWRPQTWEAVVGQQHVVGTLRNALAAGKVVHAYLFAGPRGTGKTTTARLLAKAVNCLDEDLAKRPCGQCAHCTAMTQGRFLDLIEIDAASNTSVEDVRDLRDKINFSPNQARYKVYIIDEVHMLSTAAFNALLKTLEEPPPHAIFVLATTEVHKIPATVLSRCQRHEFRRIPVTDIVAQLGAMAEDENIQVEAEALTLIARQATGSMRDAISLLDQLASAGQKITLKMAQDVLGTAASQAVLDLIQAVVDHTPDAGLDCLHSALDSGSDPRQFARQVVDYLREVLLILSGNAEQVDATADLRLQMGRHARAFGASELLRVIRVFNQAATEGRGTWQPSLPLEMAFIEALERPVVEAPDQEVLPPPIQPAPGPKASRSAAPAAELSSKSAPERARPAPGGTQVREEVVGPSAEPAPQGDVPAETPQQSSPQDQQATQTLSEAWQRILAAVRQQNPKAYGYLNSCKSRFMRGDTLVINFASDLLKSSMEKPENLDVVQRVLFQIFQREITVHCLVDTARRDSMPPGVEDDGMIAAALRDLGGELADIQ